MPNYYERLIYPFLSRLDPETAHDWVSSMAEFSSYLPFFQELSSFLWRKRNSSILGSHVLGLNFENPIGLAAGFDKDGRLLRFLPQLGFGFIEVGAVTLKPQPGHPRPRLFRIPEYEALINRMGFNSEGLEKVSRRLSQLKPRPIPIGINLGLNAETPAEEAPFRYAEIFKILEPHGDYFAVNVSSPNTTGLRDLQERRHLERILISLQAENLRKKPILIKISPDLEEKNLEALCEISLKLASGLIATNTTLQRPGLPPETPERRGGLSGAPLRFISTQIIAKIYRMTQGQIPIIGVGGVFSGADAFEKIRAGASLIQIYTALVYRGPGIVSEILSDLEEILKSNGFESLSAAVGSGA